MSVADYLKRKQRQNVQQTAGQPLTGIPVAEVNTGGQEQEQQQPVTQTTQTQTETQKSMTYDDILTKLNNVMQPTPEEKQRQARNKVIAGVGDAISSIANLVAVNKGAANAFTPTLSNAYQKYYDRLKAEQAANKQAALNYYYKQLALDAEQAEAARQQRNKDRDYDFDVAKEEARKAEQARKEAADKEAFEYKKQHDDDVLKLGKERNRIAAARAANAAKGNGNDKEDYTLFNIGGGQIAKIPNEALNELNIEAIYNILPLEDEEVLGAPYAEYDPDRETYITKYRPWTKEQKLELIGKYMSSDPEVAQAVRELAELSGGEVTSNDVEYLLREEENNKKEDNNNDKPLFFR